MTRIWGCAALIGAIGLVAAPAFAQTVHMQLPVEAAMQDAAAYAKLFDLPFDQAMQRMRAQSASVPTTDALRAEFADRLAGVAIEHRPAYRIVVLLTGGEPVADRTIVAGDMVVPIVFRTGASATRETVVAKIREFQADIRATLPHPPGIGLDQRTGEMVVMVANADLDLDRDGALSRRFATMTGVPVRIEAVDRPPVDMAQDGTADIGDTGSDPIGGARVVGSVDGKRYVCTTGFVVTDGTRPAIATAAHCPDTLSYVGRDRRSVDLAFDGQWGWGYQDVQINLMSVPSSPPSLSSGAPTMPAPLFYADTAKTLVRSVATWRNRTSTRAGDIVCHRGERTGYSCAPVAMVDFAPAGDLCGGACSPTWVAVEGPTCKAGDSGAPVFDGRVALGLVKGGTYRADGSCLFYYYMSTDYLPPGWTLLYR